MTPSLTIHTAFIDHPVEPEHFHSSDPEILRQDVADFCRRNWESDAAIPDGIDEIIEVYFDMTRPAGYEQYITWNEFDFQVPQPFASVNHLLEEIDEMRKLSADCENEHDMAASLNRINWLSRKAIESVQTRPERKLFTVFCQQDDGAGTIWIGCVSADDLDSAIEAGRRSCLEDWNGAKDEDAEDTYTIEDIHCLGVSAGDIKILHWEDKY